MILSTREWATDHDWQLRFYTTDRTRAFVASYVGGVATNCFDDGGHVHVVFDNHGLSCGTLKVMVIDDLPNGIYPDGTQHTVNVYDTGVRLVSGASDDDTALAVELMVPYAVIDAYAVAVRSGYKGTQEDYYSGLGMLSDLSSMVSDVAQGKQAIASALNTHGVDISTTSSFETMADSIRALRLAVEDDPGIVSQMWHGLEVTDLLNIIRNHQRTDLPYCWIAQTQDNLVTLTGADGYLCSDGYYTTESGTTHEIADNVGHPDNWVIYYYASPRYTVKNTLASISGIVVLNGYPDYNLNDATDTVISGMVRSYTEDMPPEGEIQLVRFVGTEYTDVQLRGIVRVDTSSQFPNGGRLCKISYPDLEYADAVVCTKGDYMKLLYLPKLKHARQSVATGAKFERVWLPELTEVTTPSNWPSVVSGATLIKELHLPKLVSYGYTQYTGMIQAGASTPEDAHVYLDSLTANSGYVVHITNAASTAHVHVHFGTHEDVVFSARGGWCTTSVHIPVCHIHIGKGFRCAMPYCNTFGATTHDELVELIDNLADNTGYAAKTINFGETLRGKLTDDEIAIAAAKNYTIT